ncbi:phosphate transport system protein [Methanolinea mesophila]|uniref:phosphate signaling complex protein PhoU n=1 Tax=Methanolinea mesophila TaxID=547055 RepID=UPI001AE2BBA5|nr:phosphate signaling complex protein PhoU [Methanolinea mesophila]MBP1928215.1 phosphate transport system protein [Methanolinea mesophila]
MSEKFHAELEDTKTHILSMAAMAEEMLRDSMTALEQHDRNLAMKVKERKTLLSEKNDTLEEEVYQLIARYQPVAKDMRAIACALKVISAAERIGRYGKDIANVVIKTPEDSRFEDLVRALSLPHMSELVLSMIHDAIQAYDTGDVSLIAHHSARDDRVDALRHTIFRDGITYMMEDPRTITRCTNYLMVARYLERSADHSCKIAEKVHYMVTGERIEIR